MAPQIVADGVTEDLWSGGVDELRTVSRKRFDYIYRALSAHDKVAMVP